MPLWNGDTPCWEARCDRCGCGDGHFDTKRELIESLEADGWYIVPGDSLLFGGMLLYCAECTALVLTSMKELREAWVD